MCELFVGHILLDYVEGKLCTDVVAVVASPIHIHHSNSFL